MDDMPFEPIESHRFSAVLNVAGDLKTFVRGINAMPEISAAKRLTGSEGNRRSIFDRLIDLAERPIDPACENPWDMALAAYLFLLSTADGDLASKAADVVLGCSNCWWSRKLAEWVNSAHR